MPLAKTPFTLDQLQVFLVVADAKSFSGAGRDLGRAQSAVSFVIATLEEALGVSLFARSSRGLTLTPSGQAIKTHARRLLDQATVLSRTARDLAAGHEAEVMLAVDVLYPLAQVTKCLKSFKDTFPNVAVRLFVEPLGGVAKLVLDRVCGIGIIASLPDVPDGLSAAPLGSVDVVAVVAPDHPLALKESWPDEVLREHLQLVVTDRTTLSEGRDFAVFGGLTWRTSDLTAKHQMILAGMGWGALPLHLVVDDLAAERLIKLSPAAWRGEPLRLQARRIHNSRAPMGPATAHLVTLLDEELH